MPYRSAALLFENRLLLSGGGQGGSFLIEMAAWGGAPGHPGLCSEEEVFRLRHGYGMS